MTNLSKEIKELEEKLAELKEKHDAAQKEPVEVVGQYKAEIYQDYFSIHEFGFIDDKANYHQEILDKAVLIGTSFRTREQAERRLESIKTHEELRRLAHEAWGNGIINWCSHTQHKYYVELHFDDFLVDFDLTYKRANTVYFPTKQSAQDAIEKIGEERIKQYIEGDQ